MSTAVDEWPRSIERTNSIDTAYRTKYHCYGDRFISLMISPEARAATFKVLLHP
ncbi:MAG: hypothetical protein ACJ8CB_01280 [Ktedonobacteraceae bacterium]